MGVVRSGFRLPWKGKKAPLARQPILFPPPADPEACRALDLEVQALISKEAVQVVLNHESPGFYGRLFVVPKASGGWRPVLDLSTLNAFLVQKHFRMETASSIRDSMRPGDWAISVDLKDAYFHLLIHPADRKYLRFAWKGMILQFRSVPFGLAPAPWLFTKITKELCRVVRSQGIRLKVYLDDWLLLAQERDFCLQHSKVVLDLCARLGFILNEEKSDLVPAQRFQYLGMTFDTVLWTVAPSPQRIHRLQEALLRARESHMVTSRSLASILGSMESMALLLPLGRLHKRSVQRLFLSGWLKVHKNWNRVITLGKEFDEATVQWLDQKWLSQGVPITLPQPQEILFTDASNVGWGAHMGTLTAAGQWPAALVGQHINMLELEAVWLALQQFQDSVQGKHVMVNTDNTSVAFYINKQGGAHSFSLSLRAEQLLLWCQDREIVLTARYLPGKLNILADSLSRAHMILPSEWTLAHNVLQPIWDQWGRPHVDLFATRFSKRLPIYVSPVPDPEAWAVDALSIPWSSLLAYAFPPFPILGKVIRKAREDQATLILVAPLWEAQTWFPDLLHLSHLDPIQLELGPHSIVQPRTGIPHGNPEVLNLHAWFLCGNRCVHGARRRR